MWLCGARSVVDLRRIGQNGIHAPNMTVYLVISLPKLPYTHRIYMILANAIHTAWAWLLPDACCLHASFLCTLLVSISANHIRSREAGVPKSQLLC